LYFTKPAGEKNFNVYAQYDGGKTWVPLQIAFPANPTLQQVRDADRNIAMDTGSYEDAHFYLRSAAGNNMTAAYFTNEAGGGIQVGNTDDYAPLNLQPEGGMLTYGGAEVATRQWVSLYGLTYMNTPVTNFNTVTTQGIYTIYNSLSAIANYPNVGGNNNGATGGYLVVYGASSDTVQYFYPINEAHTLNRSGGYWYRRTPTDAWEYKGGILEIHLNLAPVHADDMLVNGDYHIGGSMTNMLNYGYPDSGALGGGSIPFILAVRRRWGNAPWNYSITQELVCVQESPANLTRKWIRSRFNWRSTGNPWDAWNEVALQRDVYTKTQLQTSGSGNVHWNNITNKPALVSAETDPTVPSYVKAITTDDIDGWNAKEDVSNKSTSAALGTSNTLYPTQHAVKSYVDNAIGTNNGSFIPVIQKGAANGVATLDTSGKIPNDQLPALAITDTFTVSSEAEMLALTAEPGDVAVRSDISKTFILKTAPASSLLNWIELKAPTITSSDLVPEGTVNLYFTNTRARSAMSVSAPLTYDSANGKIGITQAGSGSNGYLSASDWSAFNGKEPAFAKNTAFNRNFGTAAGTVAEGNDSRINNGQTAFSWGDHTGLYPPVSRTITINGTTQDLSADRSWDTNQTLSLTQNATPSLGYDLTISNGNTVNLQVMRYRSGPAGNWSQIPRNHAGYMYDGTSDAPPFNQPNGSTAGCYITFGHFNDYPSAIMALAANPYSTDGDFLFWKKNYDGATSGSSWYQVASRQWADNRFALTAHTHTLQEVTDTGHIRSVNADGPSWSAAAGGSFFILARQGGNYTHVYSTGSGLGMQTSDNLGGINGTISLQPSGGSLLYGGNEVATRIWVMSQIGNGVLNMNVTGIGTGSANFAANQSGTSTFTVNLPSFGTTAGTVAQGNDSRFHDPVTLPSPANGLSLNGQMLSISVANSATTGALSAADWSTFNNKAAATGAPGYIQNQNAAPQNASFAISGTGQADAFRSSSFSMPDNSRVGGDNNYWGFLTSTNGALPIKAGSLAITSSYTNSAPTNGLYVEGQSYLAGGAILENLANSAPGTYRLLTQNWSSSAVEWVDVSAISNWWDYNSFPAPYVIPSNPPNGAMGVDTRGGFAASGVIITDLSYIVRDYDYSILFYKECDITLPPPHEFPGRILKLRAGPYHCTFSGYQVNDYGNYLAHFTKSIEIQSIDNEWQLLSASAS